MEDIYFFTNIAPNYRAPIWNILLKKDDWNTHFFYSDDPNSGLKMIDSDEEPFALHKDQLHTVKSLRRKNNKQWWQSGIIKRCLLDDFQHAFFLGEISRLSTWISIFICRLRGVKVTLWGHGLYGNESKIRLLSKKLLFHLAHSHLLYERRAKKLMIKEGFKADTLYVVFNSLDYDTHKQLNSKFSDLDRNEVFNFFKNPELPVIIFIGRLTRIKKINLVVKAINSINYEQTKLNLLLIGDGSEMDELKIMGEEGLINKWLHFTGACFDEEIIGKYLSKADLCVSPGNVGLTAIHALSFGTPVCTHDNMANQMPEAEAIQDGYNGFFFKENDMQDLKLKIEEWFQLKLDRDLIRQRCLEIIEKHYNPYYQLSVFQRLIDGNKPEL